MGCGVTVFSSGAGPMPDTEPLRATRVPVLLRGRQAADAIAECRPVTAAVGDQSPTLPSLSMSREAIVDTDAVCRSTVRAESRRFVGDVGLLGCQGTGTAFARGEGSHVSKARAVQDIARERR
jgi:hypothetical protein